MLRDVVHDKLGNMEEQKVERKQTVISRREVQDFIVDRNIDPEDLCLIEKLASFPKEVVIIRLHNFFNTYREGSGKELDAIIQNTTDSSMKSLYEVINRFYKKYDWPASLNLVRLLEKI